MKSTIPKLKRSYMLSCLDANISASMSMAVTPLWKVITSHLRPLCGNYSLQSLQDYRGWYYNYRDMTSLSSTDQARAFLLQLLSRGNHYLTRTTASEKVWTCRYILYTAAYPSVTLSCPAGHMGIEKCKQREPVTSSFGLGWTSKLRRQ